MRGSLLSLLVALAAAAPAAAAPQIAGQVTAVPDGMTLGLADGTLIRLAGIRAPLPPLGSPAGTAWPWARAARAALVALAQGREVALRGPVFRDRYGRLVGQAWRTDGLWLEGALLSSGQARVETTPEEREEAAEMLAREAAARRQGLGLWQAAYYRVRRPDQLEHASGSFQLVEGRVGTVESRYGTLRLFFTGGDLEAEITRPALALFRREGIDPYSLAGQRLRLRGWLRWAGHPILELTHPEEVEALDAAAPY